ncbi:MAG: hypothetical protein Q7J46_14210 [Pseudomonas sp.]|nr:hypothetical protein [Pseudomonas sp.]
MQRFINNWGSLLIEPVSAAAVTLTINAADAAQLTGLAEGHHYLLTLVALGEAGEEVGWEIIKAASVSAGALTVEREYEGPPARDWPAGTPIRARLTAAVLDAITLQQHTQQQQVDLLVSGLQQLTERVAELETAPPPSDLPEGLLVDQTGNPLVDQSGNYLTETSTEEAQS